MNANSTMHTAHLSSFAQLCVAVGLVTGCGGQEPPASPIPPDGQRGSAGFDGTRPPAAAGAGSSVAAGSGDHGGQGGRSAGGAVSVLDRPNILFVFSDDHGRQAISAYGSDRNVTPNIDRLAREGMLFENAFVTNSICGPARAVTLTGKYNHLSGMMGNRETFDGEQQTFPKLLRTFGYQTAIIGKWHLKSTPTGFDHFDVLIGQGDYYNSPTLTLAADGRVVESKNRGYTTDLITDKVLAWLQTEREPSKPFMLMYQHKAPHRGWEPALPHLGNYDEVTLPEPPTLFDDYAGRATPAAKQRMMVAKHLNDRDLKLAPPQSTLTAEQRAIWDAAYGPKNAAFRAANLAGDDLVRWKYQRYAKDYLRCVDSIDENLGRVLEYLDASGLAQSTVVIYTSDQGWYLGEHGWFDKRWMYEESLTIPLIVRWPGAVAAGSRNSDLVSNLDFAETFLDLAGIPVPEDMQGHSLRPLLLGSTPPDWRRSVYYHHYGGGHGVPRHHGVRTASHKLIHYPTMAPPEWELFDLKSDPNELSSAHAAPESAALTEELLTEMGSLREQYQVP